MNSSIKRAHHLNILLTLGAAAGVAACGGNDSTEHVATNTSRVTATNIPRSTTGPVPPRAVVERDALKRAQARARTSAAAAAAETVIPGVPAYLWRHGCGPTAAGMIAGYYDAKGYPLIDGDATAQTAPVNQAIASGGDDTSTQFPPGSEQHFEDYAAPMDPGNELIDDAYITAGRSPHGNNSIADYMNTSRSSLGLKYGWSYDMDLETGLVGFVNQKEPAVTVNHMYYPESEMTWSVLTREIDAQRPMVFLVDTDGNGGTDHFVTVIGYREAPSRQYASWDTWSTSIRWEDFLPMTSGVPWGVYSGHAFSLSGLACSTNSQCDDSVACTLDTCANGHCTHDSSACGCVSNSECDDGDFCNGIETCVSNACVPGTQAGSGCSQATLLSRYQNSGNFNTTGEKWFYTTEELNGWWTANTQGRTIRVNGQVVTPGSMPLPAPIDGKRYFQFTSGTYAFTSWGFW
jgi:hypothetical protein